MGIATVRDLLLYFPRSHEDLSPIIPVATCRENMSACVEGAILDMQEVRTFKKRMHLATAIIQDASGSLRVLWFNQPYLATVLKKGDRVLIERAGEVIPKVVKVVEARGKKQFAIPQACPECRGKVVKEKEEDVAYRCINPSCPAQIERGLIHFASRSAMDIEGMGEAAVQQLVREGLVNDFAGIYNLKKSDLLKLELFKDKKSENLLQAIQRSKLQALSRLIYGLGIRHVGEKAAFVLAQKFKTLDRLIGAKKEEFDAIYEVGDVLASSVVDFFKQETTHRLIHKLKAAGLNLEEKTAILRKSALTGKNIVFTGELQSFSRSEAEGTVRQYGANASSSVTKNTDFVVAGDNPGSKYDQAKKLGVKIIGEKEFRQMLK